MRNSVTGIESVVRIAALTSIFALGLISIVGSGGGAEGADCSFFSNTCNPTVGPSASAYIFPTRTTVQVGGTATFTASTPAPNPTYQWKRSSDGGQTYSNIPGETGATYTLVGASLADDGALFDAEVSSPGTLVFGPYAGRLAVSSMPGIVFQDGEFQASNWTAVAIADPAQNGPTHVEEQATSGGNPGAYRRMEHTLTQGAISLRVLNIATTAIYDPTTQGAIYTIDFAEDCLVANGGASMASVESRPLIEQNGRRYMPFLTGGCASPAWHTLSEWPSLGRENLFQVDGPACGSAESCPDFSGTGAPLRFGFVRAATQSASAPASTIEHGIDNWKVTVWRR